MPSKLKIYTRTGDQGLTSLYDGKRVSKSDLRVEAYGTVDELNSSIGLVISHVKEKQVISFLTKIQSDLLIIGAHLAGNAQNLSIIANRVVEMEKFIDHLDKGLAPLKNFILPSGGKSSSFTHLARSIGRRAEREVVELANNQKGVDKSVIIYLNRLSDTLFIISRFINKIENKKEIIWNRSV